MLALVRGSLCPAVMLAWWGAAEIAPLTAAAATCSPLPPPVAQLRLAPASAPPSDASDAAPPTRAPRPPRIDGPYLGSVFAPSLTLARLGGFPSGRPLGGFTGTLAFGQMVLPWLGLGLQVGGGYAVGREAGERQRLGQGVLLVDARFVPLARIPLTLRASFGFGGGAVRQSNVAARSGFGGAAFGAGVRYEFFPGAKRYRAERGGGFGLGPEIGWLGFTPAAAGRPMAHTLYLGLASTFYFGA